MPRDDEGLEHVILNDSDGETRTRKPGKQQNKRRSAAKRIQRSNVLFARVPLPWLLDRRNDAACPARTRLYLYLIIKSREGAVSVKLTNAMAEEIGLDRFAKARALIRLQRAGCVSVQQAGHEAPTVTVLGSKWSVG